MVVKSEVTVLEQNPVIHSDMTTSPWLPREGLVTVMVTAVTSRGNNNLRIDNCDAGSFHGTLF